MAEPRGHRGGADPLLKNKVGLIGGEDRSAWSTYIDLRALEYMEAAPPTNHGIQVAIEQFMQQVIRQVCKWPASSHKCSAKSYSRLYSHIIGAPATNAPCLALRLQALALLTPPSSPPTSPRLELR
jgi:hypothetical protein